MTGYAARTDVPVGRSRDAIDALLRKHGATTIAFVEDDARVACQFWLDSRHVRFVVPFRVQRTKAQREQEHRSRWRALLLVIRGRLESVEAGISTVEEAFLANVVLPDGSTVAESVAPRIAEAYELGAVRPLLVLEP